MQRTNVCCPACGQPFTRPDVENGADLVTMLAKAILGLSKMAQLSVELPVHDGPLQAHESLIQKLADR